ncbi:unnamed protein product [Caenorhabditis sp. 36 PRJEB53466]|nr:unnamed protein product [Caenorhabditis sp. 36 PRJEB53466]
MNPTNPNSLPIGILSPQEILVLLEQQLQPDFLQAWIQTQMMLPTTYPHLTLPASLETINTSENVSNSEGRDSGNGTLTPHESNPSRPTSAAALLQTLATSVVPPYALINEIPSHESPSDFLESGSPVHECIVCGLPSKGFNYGVRSCDGCKSFFSRCLEKPVNKECMRGVECIIYEKNSTATRFQKRCQACRYRRCIDMGMRRERTKNKVTGKMVTIVAREQERTSVPPTMLTQGQISQMTQKSLDPFVKMASSNGSELSDSETDTLDPREPNSSRLTSAELLPHTSDLSMTSVTSLSTLVDASARGALISPSFPKNNLLGTNCVVCNEPESRAHWGARTCSACGSFFRRCVENNFNKVLTKKHKCGVFNGIMSGYKNPLRECEPCRFQKCLDVGMRDGRVLKPKPASGITEIVPDQ